MSSTENVLMFSSAQSLRYSGIFIVLHFFVWGGFVKKKSSVFVWYVSGRLRSLIKSVMIIE